MLQPPSMPSARMILRAAERSIWWSSSDSVCDGATTMDSPVWMPIGSMFSMLQMVMQVSLASRITSYSNSFQPRMLSSTRTWWMRDRFRPISAMLPHFLLGVGDAAAGAAQRVGRPDDQRQAELLDDGRPLPRWCDRRTDRGTGSPMASMACLNRSRSSVS